MIIVPEMIGSVVGVYNGKMFNVVEIKVSLSPCTDSFVAFMARKVNQSHSLSYTAMLNAGLIVKIVLCTDFITFFSVCRPRVRWWVITSASSA